MRGRGWRGSPVSLDREGGRTEDRGREQYVDIAAMTRLTPGAQGSIYRQLTTFSAINRISRAALDW